jgi:nucleoside phosphorylase
MSYDFCVICAKPDELGDVIAVFDGKFNKGRGPSVAQQGYVVRAATGSRKCTISVTTTVGMGHLNAAVRTAQVVHSHQPGILFFIGTAATLKPGEIQVGDVVIPRKAVNRIYEKISEQGQSDYERRVRLTDFREMIFENRNALISDIATVNSSPDAMTIAAQISADDIELEQGELGTVTVGEQQYTLRLPRIFNDVDIFSCGMVVDSVSYREFLTRMADENMRKVGIIDMESYGFFNAIEAIRDVGVSTSTQGIMIRGISDYAGRKEQTERLPANWKQKAVRNAAIVAGWLIQKIADLEPM